MLNRDPLALAARYGPSVILALIVVFMVWVRLIPIDRVITDSAVYYSGNDPWYHNRMVHYIVRNFPHTTPFDPWSYFPFGTGSHSGFGGLFDQLIALAALIVGVGSPSDHTVDVITALAPPAFGALTAIPTYVLAKRLTDRWGGLLAASLLALSGGGLLARTIVGTADHQSAEAFFGATALAGFAYAVAAAYRESPMLEDVEDRNWSFLRRPVLAGVGGGIVVAAYLTMWAPGVMVLFTFGVFIVLQLTREHSAGRPTDHLAIGAIAAMGTTGLLTLLYARSYTLSSTEYSLLQPLVAFGLAVGTAVTFWLSRYFEREGYPRRYYPPAVGSLILVSFLAAWVVYPRTLNLLESLFTRIYSFGYFTSVTAGTVAEIQPPSVSQTFDTYGMILLLAVVGALLLAYRIYTDDRPVDLLTFLWCFTMFSAYFTMARFGYYFSVVVALLAGFAVWWILKNWLAFDLDVSAVRTLEDLRSVDVNMYQIIGLLVILLLVAPGNIVAMSGQQPVWEQAESPVYTGTDQAWYDGMRWLATNSPEIPLGYYDMYEQPVDGDFEYPPGAYGVMSWWDYGHWITVIGERVPYANPFQQNPRPASAFFQETNETRANLILEALPSLSSNPSRVAGMTTAELETAIADQNEQQADENGRYVAIDDQMAAAKFPAITQWAGPGTGAYFESGQYRFQGRNVSLPVTTQRYDRTMLARMYYDDASDLAHYRLVHEVDRYAVVGGYIDGQRVRSLTQLRLRGGWSDTVGIAAQIQQARRTGQVVPIGGNQFVYNAHVESRVKIYERVDGAQLTGSVPNGSAGTLVYAVLELQSNTNRNFTYVQQTRTGPDGRFTLRVPYPTNDTIGPTDGGTDSSVIARSSYRVQAGGAISPTALGSVSVPEEAIYEGQEIQITLKPIEQSVERESNQTTVNESASDPGSTNDNVDGSADLSSQVQVMPQSSHLPAISEGVD